MTEVLCCQKCRRQSVTLKAIRANGKYNIKSGKVSKGKVLGYICKKCEVKRSEN
jgi:predicted nucleic-acid-binding Zn-ribbon protein